MPQRGVGERGDQDRADPVRQCPPLAVAGDAVRVVAAVEVDLDGGGGPHHHPAPRAPCVEVLLHRPVARVVQQPRRVPVRVEPAAGEFQPGAGERVPQRLQVRGGGPYAVGEGGGGPGAELDLTARLQGQPGPVRQSAGGLHGRESGVEPGGRDRTGAVGAVVHQPLQFDADAAGRAGLEADTAEVLLGLGLRQERVHGGPLVRGAVWVRARAGSRPDGPPRGGPSRGGDGERGSAGECGQCRVYEATNRADPSALPRSSCKVASGGVSFPNDAGTATGSAYRVSWYRWVSPCGGQGPS